MIEIRHLQKIYNVDPVINDLSVTINDGDIISIIGPSGCGKSTFIRCINMLERPTGGQILIDGEDITAKDYDVSKISRKIGMVFQSFNLFNHLTVIENLMAPQIDTLGKSRQEAYDNSLRLLKQVNLSSKAFSYPESLSGGQKQRAAIARTLAMDPEIILFDEPTSALDPSNIAEVKAVIRSLTKSDKTLIIVTHDMDFARSIAKRTFYFDEGGIYEEGPADQIFTSPRREKTRYFINKSRILEINMNSEDFDTYGAYSLIDSYCHNIHVNGRRTYHLQTVFNELCVESLMPLMDEPHLRFLAEYNAETDQIAVTISYGKKQITLGDIQNEIALTMVKGITDSIVYSPCEGMYANTISVAFRSSNK